MMSLFAEHCEFIPSPGTPGEGRVRALLEHDVTRLPEGPHPSPSRRTGRGGKGRRHDGTVLIAAIVIVFALASMVLVLCRSMAVEAQASANQAAAIQAAAVARGAEQYVLGIVANSDTQAPL